MIILYLPFATHGDLLKLLEIWQANSRDSITIVKHNEQFQKFPFEKSEVYICAHGSVIENQLFLFNKKNKAERKKIDIPTLVKRFEKDFLYVTSQIDKIHLYFCGSAKKNQLLAQSFQSSLSRPEYSDICFYSGDIKEPDTDGKRWSHSDSGVLPIEEVCQTLPRKKISRERSAPPSQTVRRLQEKPNGNHHRLFAKRNAWREERLAQFRRMDVDLESPLSALQEQQIAASKRGDVDDKELGNKISKLSIKPRI